PMSTVDQHQQLHTRRPALFEQSIERGTDRTAGVEDIVHQHDVFCHDVEADVGVIDDRLYVYRAEVVTVEVDVKNAHGNLAVLEGFDLGGQALRQRNAPAADSDECQPVQIFGAFQDFVGKAYERAVDLRRTHELCFHA